ncbi:MAG TPA: FemAB family XrtA/PEP-CTERM system-associated protein [Vicinamibacterales bacterium]|nr:FemAB family XrtA/PEP-CTERM system-associated protein [Vicinamibacterales bacterium]
MIALPQRIANSLPLAVRDNLPPPVCDAYVAGHPQGSSYHRPAWLDVIRSAFGHETTYLAAECAGRVAGVLPLVFFDSRLFGRFTVSVPFVNYGGVLADDLETERALLDAAIERTRQAGGTHLELRHTRQHFAHLTPRHHKVAMELLLQTSVDAQWDRIDRKLRNQVRKAEKSGLDGVDGGGECLASFYDVFAENMRDLGTPVYSPRFFREVLRTFPEQTRVFVVRLKGRPIAASIVHWHGDVIQVPWASSLREFNPLCANVLLYWQMLRFAIGRRFRLFDFGRSTPGEGTYQFKKQWGAEARPLVWEYWTAPGQRVPELNPANPKFELAIRTWQRLPVRVANLVGPLVVRNIP